MYSTNNVDKVVTLGSTEQPD